MKLEASDTYYEENVIETDRQSRGRGWGADGIDTGIFT